MRGFQSVCCSEAGSWGGLCGGLTLSHPYHLATSCWMSLSEVTANLIPICQRGYYVDSCEVCQSVITVGIPLEHCV